MTLRQLLFLVFAATAVLWAGWFWTVWTVDPQATNWIGFMLFYSITFMVLLGTCSLLGITIRHKRDPQALVYDLVSVAFRQSFLLSSLATFLLALQGQRLVRWYIIAGGFLLVVGIETYFVYRDARRRGRSYQAQQKRGVSPSLTAAGPSPTFTKRSI